MTLSAVSVSHGTAGVAVRERVELSERRAGDLVAALVARTEIQEAVALSTCNRTEIYLEASAGADAAGAAADELAGSEAWLPPTSPARCAASRARWSCGTCSA